MRATWTNAPELMITHLTQIDKSLLRSFGMATCIVVGFKKDLYRASEVLNELIDRGYEWTTDLADAVAAYRD